MDIWQNCFLHLKKYILLSQILCLFQNCLRMYFHPQLCFASEHQYTLYWKFLSKRWDLRRRGILIAQCVVEELIHELLLKTALMIRKVVMKRHKRKNEDRRKLNCMNRTENRILFYFTFVQLFPASLVQYLTATVAFWQVNNTRSRDTACTYKSSLRYIPRLP